MNRAICLTAAGAAPFTFSYQNNSANQRTQNTLADSSYWVYQYDELGQVTSGKRYWSDGTPVAGQQFEYAFDDIGNRTQTKAGGDENGANLRTNNYTATLLNQYTNRTVTGAVDVMGVALLTNTVTVNSQSPYRRGEYFRKELSVSNGSGPVWQAVTVSSGGSNVTGNVLVSQNVEAFTYDLDGNLTSDSLWTNVWDGENRRISVESRSSVPTGGKVKEEWTHLSDGRWMERIVSTNNGSGYVAFQTNRYVWDGQVLLAVLNHTNGLELFFVRGLDLSGSLQGAGGVGGLLAVQVGAAGPSGLANTTHLAAYDGNGNVVALVNAASGAESARYEYGPFAEPLRLTGVMAKVNPLRFSTQYADDHSGDVKYLYRDYDADAGRWLSRDPIGERGGKNLYIFSGNDAVDFFDVLGLAWKIERNGRDRAHAKPESGDTVEDLAKLIRFDNKDYRKWLKPVGPTRIPGSATEPITGCAEFTIPNTVFVDIGPRIHAPLPWYLVYVDKINATFTLLSAMARGTGDLYESKGFNVVRTEQATGTDIRNHLGSPNIHAYVFAGHGGNGAINSTEDDAVFPGRYTQYGIQYMGLLACGSALDDSGEGMNNYPSNVARRGMFFGSVNNYTALLAIMLGFDEYVFIWTPGTNE